MQCALPHLFTGHSQSNGSPRGCRRVYSTPVRLPAPSLSGSRHSAGMPVGRAYRPPERKAPREHRLPGRLRCGYQADTATATRLQLQLHGAEHREIHGLEQDSESRADQSRADQSRAATQNSELRIQNSELRTQNSEFRIQNSEFRTQNSEFRTQNSELRIQNSELRIQNSELRIQNSEFRTQNSEHSK